jgi:dipeptidyl-peptidase-3
MLAEAKRARGIHMIDESERSIFGAHRFTAYYVWVVLHEIMGHGTGKLLLEQSPGIFNFDKENLPVNPLTGKPIDRWYLPGETWTGVFGDLATTVDECRAELVGAYLIDEPDILELFGCTDDNRITPDDGKTLFLFFSFVVMN